LTTCPNLLTFPSTLDEGSVTAMATGKFVSYLRVSTERQGQSGLGLDAQRKAVLDFLNGGRWTHVAEFVEVESGSKDDRPKLADAMALARAHGATLLIAKLDRLSRDAAFLIGLQKAGVKFVAADMPEANEMVVGIMAVVAQAERKMISKRTKEALAAAKARGVKLGGFRGYVPTAADTAAAGHAKAAKANAKAADLRPIFDRLGSLSLRQMAAALTAEGIPTPAGGEVWTAVQVSRIRARIS
jgi:DNA invertase Pin-like site-specific DNA recombinase